MGRKALSPTQLRWRYPYKRVLDILTERTLRGESTSLAELTEIGILPQPKGRKKPSERVLTKRLSGPRVHALLKKLVGAKLVTKVGRLYKMPDSTKLDTADYVIRKISETHMRILGTPPDPRTGQSTDRYGYICTASNEMPMNQSLRTSFEGDCEELLKDATLLWCNYAFAWVADNLRQIVEGEGKDLNATGLAALLLNVRDRVLDTLGQLGWLDAAGEPDAALLGGLGALDSVSALTNGYGLDSIQNRQLKRTVGRRINALVKAGKDWDPKKTPMRDRKHQAPVPADEKKTQSVRVPNRKWIEWMANRIVEPLTVKSEPIIIGRGSLVSAGDFARSARAQSGGGFRKPFNSWTLQA